jgi:hypothetical protein
VNYRLVLYWLLSMLALCACLWLPTEHRAPRQLPPIDLTKTFRVEPSFLYFHDQRFHAVAGNRLIIGLKKGRLKRKFPYYNTLIIEDLNIGLNKTISLNWQIRNKSFKVPLNLSNRSVNRINFGTKKAKLIKNLHLLIEHSPEMGTNSDPQDEVTFKAIYLSNGAQWNQLDVDVSEWLDFSPVKFNSINGYTSADNTHLSVLVLKIMVWVLINVLLYWILRVNGHHLLVAIMTGWILVSVPYWYNFWLQHEQLETAFPENHRHLNTLDQMAFEAARNIKSTLQQAPQINLSATKLVIVGPNDFIYLRLFYHLLEFDVAVYNNLSDLKDAGEHTVFVFFAETKPICNLNLVYQWHLLGTEVIQSLGFESTPQVLSWMVNNPEFCLVKAP